MPNKYCLSYKDLQQVKNEIRNILIARAKVRGMIAYSELTIRLTTIPVHHHSAALFGILGDISTEENSAGRGMLSALVIHKKGDQEPGPGFFELAAELNKNTSDILKCWITEVKKVHAYWNRPENINNT